jgi:hypothetical protein
MGGKFYFFDQNIVAEEFLATEWKSIVTGCPKEGRSICLALMQNETLHQGVGMEIIIGL